MCSICLTSPCHPRCPNASDQVAVKTCSRCTEGIWEGEEYMDSDNGPICEECLAEMTVKEYLDFVGEGLNTA